MQSINLESKTILGISVTTSSKKEILEEIQKYLGRTAKKPFVIVTPNPEQIVAAQTDPHFAKLLGQADVALPDGIGLAFVIKRKRIPGVECMEDLVGLAAERGYPIGLIGGRGGVAVAALECLKEKHSGLRGWTFDPGEIDLGNLGSLGNLSEKIRKTKTKILFVGLGAPKQEFFIERLMFYVLHPTSPIVFMSVGGSFDMIAGRTPRAPRAAQTVHLEWLWRLLREPWRWRRQVALVKFLWLVIREKGALA